jgi:hypothetical protein
MSGSPNMVFTMCIRLALAGLLLAIIAFAIAGCGGSSAGNGITSKTPTEIVAATKAAADKATAVHVSGSVVSGNTPLTLDMDLLSGKGGRGRISQNGLGFELIITGNTVYINGSPAFYRHIGGNAAAQLFKGKWLKAPATGKDFASLTSLTDLRKLLDTTLTVHGNLAKGATSTVGGQKVIAITDTSKGGTLYVATTGLPYPIQIAKTGTEAGKITFDRWNESVSLRPPANAVDVTQLQAGH